MLMKTAAKVNKKIRIKNIDINFYKYLCLIGNFNSYFELKTKLYNFGPT